MEENTANTEYNINQSVSSTEINDKKEKGSLSEYVTKGNFDRDIKKDVIIGIANLLLTTIGGGCLSLPHKLQYLGIFWYFVFISLCCYLNYFTCLIVIKVGTKKNCLTDTDLIYNLFGKKIMTIYYLFCFLGVFGITIVYQLICKFRRFNFIFF